LRLPLLSLHFANQAQMTESDAEAIRLYFLICEDWKVQRTAPADERGLHLEFTRHFLSHARIDNPKALALLAEQLGAWIDRYDPTARDRQMFIRRMREDAFDLIRTELPRRIGELT
jgi:hypothetical protein